MAKPITRQKAFELATQVWTSHSKTRGKVSMLECFWDSNTLTMRTRASEDVPTYYVFVPSDNEKGFVIIAADDVSVPVLGFSFDSQFPKTAELPKNMSIWLEEIHYNILRARRDGIQSSNFVQQKWTEFHLEDSPIQLQTPSWNQYRPYNLQCPMDGSEYSITGCTATALAIVMRYYEWPIQGKGTTEPYITGNKLIQVPARSIEHTFQWKSMRYEYFDGKYTTEEADAVATLMADIGIAIQADYSKESTSASAKPSALYEYFDYHPSMYWAIRDDYGYEEWHKVVINELKRERPVFYSGSDGDKGGHAFVVDGYTNGYFHVNWGWGGYCNGFYFLDGLEPDDHNYNKGQRVLLNFVPNDGSTIEDWIIPIKTGIVANTKDFHLYESFQVSACILNNNHVMDFKGAYRLAVTDNNGIIKEWICDEKKIDKVLQPNYYYPELSFSCTITQDIAIGDRIRLFYKSHDSEEWCVIKDKTGNVPWEILIADEYTISESTSFFYDKKNSKLIIAFKEDVTATITYCNQTISAGIVHKPNSIEVNTKELSQGIYTVILEKGSDRKVFTFEIKPLNYE